MVRTADGWTQGKSARQVRHDEAIVRNAFTPIERTAKFRRDRAVVQAVVLDAKRRRRLSGKADSTPTEGAL